MNRLTASLFAAAALGCLAAPASADRASMSVTAGGTHITLAVDDAPGGATGSWPVPVAVAPDPEPNPFIPDVHPSREEAARAAAAGWARTESRRWERPPRRVRVMCDDPALFVPVHEGLRARVGDVGVEPCDGALCAGTPPASEAWLYVSHAGTAVTVRAKGWSDAVAAAAFVDKPWVANYAGFITRTPGRWIVARSDPGRPAGSAGEAASLARRAALGDVVSRVTARMPDPGRFDRNRIDRLVESRLVSDRLVHDRFPQKFERPYGSLYQEAVLIDASDAKMDSLARDVRRALEAERRARVGGVAGAGAVLLVVYALYRFANAFTRGYFTWSLRTAAAAVAAGAVTLIAAVA